MKAKTLTIYWHGKQPVYSCDFEKVHPYRLATAGADSTARIWSLSQSNGEINVNFICTLSRHDAGVNVVKWCPNKSLLATAGDDGTIMVWKQVEGTGRPSAFGQEDDGSTETWHPHCVLLGPQRAAIFDLSWSPCGNYISSASDIDNSLRVWNILEKKLVCSLPDHKHFVQGCSWSPLGDYIATQSSDRSVIIYQVKSNGKSIKLVTCLRSSKFDILGKDEATSSSHTSTPTRNLLTAQSSIVNDVNQETIKSQDEAPQKETKPQTKFQRLYHDETLTSFFRRLDYSPDGKLLLCPTGILKDDQLKSQINCVHLYAGQNPKLGNLTAYQVGLKPATVVGFSPIKYKLRDGLENIYSLPYRMVFAVATHDSVLIFDTQQSIALTVIKGLHYHHITDISWHPDGSVLFFSSSDGFCSLVKFEDGELGEVFPEEPIPLQVESETKDQSFTPVKTNIIHTEPIIQISE